MLRKDSLAARDPRAQLEEAVGLAMAVGLTVVHAEDFGVKRMRPATLLGPGAVERYATFIAGNEIDLVIVDAALTPIQQRNLERAWDCKAIDRTGLILEIFGARARTREGQLQVELAALSYQRTRLVRSWTHLERQRGGYGFLGGPGERQLEMDRRLITERIQRIKADLEKVKRTRALHRKARRRVPYPVVALVGYTNAGKSTLFNRLTRSRVAARDVLFATLDPTMRRVSLNSGGSGDSGGSGTEIVLSDTVGFISDLPTELVAAFRATLEEVIEADLIVHVRDISHSDSAAQRGDVLKVLNDLGIGQEEPEDMIEVLNKIDRLDDQTLAEVRARASRMKNQVPCSALTGTGIGDLVAAIDRRVTENRPEAELKVTLSDGAAIAWLYHKGQVLERRDDDRFAHLRVKLDPADLARFRRRGASDRS